MILISNDNVLRLLGLRSSEDLSFIEDATVTARLLDAIGGTEISGQSWPLSMPVVDLSARSVGGDSTTPTVITASKGLDVTVTVGATNGLDLAAGNFVWVLHKESYIWRVRLSKTASADATGVVLHLDPFDWPEGEDEPKSVGGKGEVLELVQGVYKGNLDDALLLTTGTKYFAEISVNAPTQGLQSKFYRRLKAVDRLRK